MPAFNIPATEIADEDLLVQKEAVWQFLKHADRRSIRKTLAEPEQGEEGLTEEEAERYLQGLEEGRPDQRRPPQRGQQRRPVKDW